VRVQWRAEDPKDEMDLRKIQVVFDVFERVATIRTKGRTNRARFTIEVPSRSDVHLRVRAGDIRIEGIEGNKDVRMTAGDLYIDVRPDSLRHVHASYRSATCMRAASGLRTTGSEFSRLVRRRAIHARRPAVRRRRGAPMIASHMQRCETVGRSAKPT
jgi:hypothetical protein